MVEVEELKEKPGDTVDIKNVKMILNEMIVLNPKSRPPAQELLARFTRLRSTYTDVWKNLKEVKDGKLQESFYRYFTTTCCAD